ncbi:Putative metal chaperone YciC [Roseimaritima multifibrata]|uniref:Metal chaperone YciC n=1 Tax=Roseimaritima multifibrata TaxID=1930274 RepID=A0A517ML71_9BACT|nr:CobW-like GTP-binding protein [Roseimaritima multifibrata]QDS95633.1 Putative metal chaperone YciC [Roseimaritima multifibrata]
MASPIRFIMVGGFLGAGKTTLISQLAKRFLAEGKHVCVVTNDQAAGLVDTELLRSQGLEVNEVAGSCFCCNFHGLTDAIEAFDKQQRPDVILAEPVGSCTDLIATIALPMMERLGEKFVHSPFAVVLKPSHGLKILTGDRKGGFSEKAEYIFRKQLEEAELILINRIDELPREKVELLQAKLAEQYPDRPVICLSAKTGENLDQLQAALAGTASPRASRMEVDYDVYADGEAELGWLNATATLVAAVEKKCDQVAVHVVDSLRDRLLELDAEPAHLKILCTSQSGVSVANLVSSDTPTSLSVSSETGGKELSLIVNARVRLAPDALQAAVEETLKSLAVGLQATVTIDSIESFRPGRPEPTFRTE